MDKVIEKPTNGVLTATEARTVLLREASERERACWSDIEAVLKNHRCHFDVSILLKAGQVIPQLTVVAD